MAGNDSNTLLLIQSDTTDGSTTFTDSSIGGSTHTITANGDVQHDTAQAKFGASSILFDGTGDNFSIPDSADWDIASSGEYTVDFWFRTSTLGSYYLIGQLDQSNLDNDGWAIGTTTGGDGDDLVLSINNANVIDATHSMSVDTWHHIAFERTTTTAYIYVDGTSIGSAANTAGTASADTLYIGMQEGASRALNGWLDEIRVSNVARYGGSNFTPETTSYSSASGGAVLNLLGAG